MQLQSYYISLHNTERIPNGFLFTINALYTGYNIMALWNLKFAFITSFEIVIQALQIVTCTTILLYYI